MQNFFLFPLGETASSDFLMTLNLMMCVFYLFLSVLRMWSAAMTTARVRWTSGRPVSWSAASLRWSNRGKPSNTSVCLWSCKKESSLCVSSVKEWSCESGSSFIIWYECDSCCCFFAVTCAVMQKTGAGLHTANSCYWDTSMDGEFPVRLILL